MKPRCIRITRAMLARRHPLPQHSDDDDKNARGIVLVIAGSVEVPGAALLAGVAVLRSGAGKLQLATDRRIAMALGLAVPEAMVLGLGESPRSAKVRESAASADAIVIGPGMLDERYAKALARNVASAMSPAATLILDAAALSAAGSRERTVITPHLGEMANLLGVDKAKIEAEPWTYARVAADQFGCVTALKGSTTYVTSPEDDRTYEYADGTVGLATSGSGDTLAGVVAGIAGRGADPLTAALWGVWAHGTAGRKLGQKIARLGFLARELLDELPSILA